MATRCGPVWDDGMEIGLGFHGICGFPKMGVPNYPGKRPHTAWRGAKGYCSIGGGGDDSDDGHENDEDEEEEDVDDDDDDGDDS